MAYPALEVVFSEHNPASWDGSDWNFSTVTAEGFTEYEPSESATGVRIDTDIFQWSLRRGRTDEFSQVSAGVFSASVHDVARDNVSAGHWSLSEIDSTYSHFRRGNSLDGSTNFSNTHLGAPVVVKAWTSAGEARTVFVGKINSWKTVYHELNRKSIQFTATDGVADLAKVGLGEGVMRNADLQPIGLAAFDYSSDVFTAAGHGLVGGEIVELTSTDPFNGAFATDTPYWVSYIDEDTFRLRPSFNGLPVDGNASDPTSFSVGQVVTPPTFPEQRSGERVDAIANCINIMTREPVWQGTVAAERGHEVMQANDEQGNAWAMLNRVARSEFSPGLYVTRQGALAFYSRYSTAVASDVVFGTTTNAKIIAYEAPDVMDRVYNQVTFYRTDPDGVLGGVPEKAESAESQANFGIRELTWSNLLNRTESSGSLSLANMAAFLVDFYSHDDAEALGELYFTPVKVYVDALTADEQLDVFELDIGHTVTIENGTDDIVQTINSIQMSGSPGNVWEIQFGMTKSWNLADADYARVGEAAAGYATIGPTGTAKVAPG